MNRMTQSHIIFQRELDLVLDYLILILCRLLEFRSFKEQR